MAELTNLETKLAEVLGLAMAAQKAGGRVAALADKEGHRDLVETLERMEREAAEAEERASALAGDFDRKKGAILKQARETRAKADKMMSTYLDRESDALDGFEFLTMAEAAEVGHWSVLGELGKRARHAGVRALVREQLPIQKRHFKEVQSGALTLAAAEDPEETG
jgi:hypothetical protein